VECEQGVRLVGLVASERVLVAEQIERGRMSVEQGCEGGVVQGVSFIDARADLGPDEQLATYYVLAAEDRHFRETKDGPAITLPELRR